MSNDLHAALQAALNSSGADDGEANGTTSPQSVYGELVRLAVKISHADEEAFPREARLSDVPLSSLDLIELTVRAEETFKVRLDEETVAGMTTVDDFVTFIEENKQ